MAVSYDAVRRICKRQDQLGEAGLTPLYKQCGTTGIRLAAFYQRVSLWLKRAHPRWGAPYICLQIDARYTMGRLPSIRTLQLWFKAAGLTKPRPQLLNSPKVWAEYPHQVWQVDAKEQQRALDGAKACWLTVVDEKSGAVLAAPVFPHGRIGQVPLGLICEQLQLIFRQWGLPQAIKIDNGRPFGDPKRLQIPLLPLWLVGYGIEPIWNRAARPTDNAKVGALLVIGQRITLRKFNVIFC